MSLKHALLGFLNYGPMTGYELKKVVDVSIAHFWNAELSQIYPTLKQLEAEGLVDMQVQVQEERPNRKVYSITDDGRSELGDWLSTPGDIDRVREPLLIKVFLGASLRREQLLNVLRHRADALRREIEAHELAPAHAEQLAQAVGVRHDAFFWRLTIEAYLRRMQAEVEWLSDAIDAIEQVEDAYFAGQRPRSRSFDARRTIGILEEHAPGPHVSRKGEQSDASHT